MSRTLTDKEEFNQVTYYLRYLLKQRGYTPSGEWLAKYEPQSDPIKGISAGTLFQYYGKDAVVLRGKPDDLPYHYALKQFCDIKADSIGGAEANNKALSKDNRFRVAKIFFPGTPNELYEQAIKKPDWALFLESREEEKKSRNR
jgi:hypothetical protein